MDITNFLWMGGYWQYVWPAYGIALFVIFYNIRQIGIEQRHVVKKIRTYWQR